jgi:hypothetical protein
MAPEDFTEFFLASAGTGGAFVGLLFVAVSIAPQRTFDDANGMSAPRQHLAEATFLTLVNGFVVSSLALVPTVNVGWLVLFLGLLGAVAAARLGTLFVRFHRHGAVRRAPWRHLLRVAGVTYLAVGVYLFEALLGWRLMRDPTDEIVYGWLAVTIIGLYALGIARAWTLLGNPRHGWSGVLNPLLDLDDMKMHENGEGPGSSHDALVEAERG